LTQIIDLISEQVMGKMKIADIVGIPVKVNIDSGGKPNGIPERR